MKTRIADTHSLAPGKALSVHAGAWRIAIFRHQDGSVHALEDRCPHRGAPLSEGIVFDDFVACRDHGWSICVRDGQVLEPERGKVKTFAVSEVNGEIWIELSD